MVPGRRIALINRPPAGVYRESRRREVYFRGSESVFGVALRIGTLSGIPPVGVFRSSKPVRVTCSW